MYFGGKCDDTKEEIMQIIGFKEGMLPFRCLGVPLTRKKLSIYHYMDLVDKIVVRVRHWSAKLQSYVGRIQFIKSVSFAITNH